MILKKSFYILFWIIFSLVWVKKPFLSIVFYEHNEDILQQISRIPLKKEFVNMREVCTLLHKCPMHIHMKALQIKYYRGGNHMTQQYDL